MDIMDKEVDAKKAKIAIQQLKADAVMLKRQQEIINHEAREVKKAQDLQEETFQEDSCQ